MKTPSFHLGTPQTTLEWMATGLVVILTFTFLVLVFLFVKYAGKNTVHFIRETLSDATGRGEIKYVLAVAYFFLILVPMVGFGLVLGKWAPEYVWIVVVSVFLGLLGLGSIDFRSAMKSGVAIMKPEPPKEVLVKTNPEPTSPPPTTTTKDLDTDTDFVLKK